MLGACSLSTDKYHPVRSAQIVDLWGKREEMTGTVHWYVRFPQLVNLGDPAFICIYGMASDYLACLVTTTTG